jgi:hypothetical protein
VARLWLKDFAGAPSQMFLHYEGCTAAEAFAPGLQRFQLAPHKSVLWAPGQSHGRRTAIIDGAQTSRVNVGEAEVIRGAQLSIFGRFWDLAILVMKG